MNEINIQSLIIDKEDFQNAQFYFSLKGIDLYMHVIQIFKSKFKEESFNYKEISSFIRYDKSLRIQFFGYLACIEEGLRSKFLIKKDITNSDMNNDFNKINFIDRQIYIFI